MSDPTDSRVAKLAAQFADGWGAEAEVAASRGIRSFESAGLVVTDPTAAPYSLVTHEYPPTLELAIAVIERLANTNHALRIHLAAAWEQGHAAGQSDTELSIAMDAAVYRSLNPYQQETEGG